MYLAKDISMHSEFEANDPRGSWIFALAAAELLKYADIAPPFGHSDIFSQIACLRAAAVGFRESAINLGWLYRDRASRRPVQSNAPCIKLAKKATKRADALCRFIGLPYEFDGHSQSMARVFWCDFRNLYAEANDLAVTWKLIGSGGKHVEAVGLPSHLGNDWELMYYARSASETLSHMRDYQCAAIRKAKLR
jgi:hypothetical protein